MRYVATKNILLLALILISKNAHADIEFWNSDLTWAGQGKCSATFTFDSGYEDIQKLNISFNLVDKAGNIIAKDTIALDAFGQSSAERYKKIHVENEEICDNTMQIIITKATAIIDGTNVDLIKSKRISARNFKPLEIRLPKN